jgi:hypothetical protein
LAERDIVKEESDGWVLDTLVSNYRGVGRFVLGLMDDVEVLESDEFKSYLRAKIAEVKL